MRATFIIATSLLFTTHCSQAQATHYCSSGIFFDQDLLVNSFGLGDDRNYTMGFGMFYASDRLRRSWTTAPVRWVSDKLFPKLNQLLEGVHPFTYSFLLANGTFTPDDLRDYNVIRDDRPYGNVTYLQSNLTRVHQVAGVKPKFIKNSSSISIGMLGTGISQTVQSEIHSWFNENNTKPPYIPRGWTHEISNLGEPTFLLTRSSESLITTRHAANNDRHTWSAEFKHGWKYSIGYYTRAEYDFNMRLGLLDALDWTYDINPLTNSNKSESTGTLYQKQTEPEIFLVVAARPAFFLYNALLNGQFKKSDYTIDFYHTKHVILQFDLAVAGRIPLGSDGALDLKWKILSGRTPEFELPGRDRRAHYWGGIDIVYTHFK